LDSRRPSRRERAASCPRPERTEHDRRCLTRQ
jgi:hypothetical protein